MSLVDDAPSQMIPPVTATPPVTTDPVVQMPGRDPVSLAVACFALTGFGAFIIFLLPRLGLDDLQWTRATYLLNGVEAIAFAAAGFLFGREVQRGRAESAERRAENAEATAKVNQEDAIKGQTLAGLVKETAAPNLENMSPATAATATDLSALVRTAERLFPHVRS